ncbi:hypothetical protein BJ508DRAFT_300278 [Ascobolus immersus RN42]|uniref:F-box domain-containing protein n=1 Tax=Ascobolus immersus RN42 TaxID=1160509 RepID=A0A3N4J1Z5_ASCIM|nr:hypothetical protein BJ508DRAFT_300278 [Ascobolus immersus RN42]
MPQRKVTQYCEEATNRTASFFRPIERLPIELLAEILAQSHDFKSLKSAIFSCHVLYNAFIEFRVTICKTFAHRKFYREELDILERLRPGQPRSSKRIESNWLPVPVSAHPVAVEYYAYERRNRECRLKNFARYDTGIDARIFGIDVRLHPEARYIGGFELRRLDIIRSAIYEGEKETFLRWRIESEEWRPESKGSPRDVCLKGCLESGKPCPVDLMIAERYQDDPTLPGRGGPYGPWLEKSDHMFDVFLDHRWDFCNSDRVRWRQRVLGTTFRRNQKDLRPGCSRYGHAEIESSDIFRQMEVQITEMDVYHEDMFDESDDSDLSYKYDSDGEPRRRSEDDGPGSGMDYLDGW